MNQLFSTQANNFVNALQTGVDPRTGLFMVSLPLVSLTGNNLLGPEISFNLNYSPLNNGDYGFGKGFSLGVSLFDNKTNLLELSNGESYRVSPGTDIVQNQKLSTFRFEYTNNMNDAEGYTIYWKEGKTELLSFEADNKFVTTRIVSPLDRTMTIGWLWNGQQVLLSEVRDETSLLCQVTYSNVVTMIAWPGTNDEYKITFNLINGNQLDVVSRQISESETLSWYLGYGYAPGGNELLLTDVTYPTGMKEHADYSQIDGHQFPIESGVYERLPAVLTYIMTPGGGQPETVRHYEYSVQNFLGYSGNFGDWTDNHDYIYTTLTDYVYGSTEIIQSGSSDILKITRTYNNYHLQLSEETTHRQCVYRKEYTYYAEENLFIDAQPAQFQLIKKQTETWTDAAGKQRVNTTLTDFDEWGNPVYQITPDGTETVTTWFKAEGEDGCPAAPHDFVRFMKSRKVTPRKTSYATPVMESRYRYTTLGTVSHIVQSRIDNYADNILLSRKAFTYNAAQGDVEYGRITVTENTRFENGESTTAYTNQLMFDTTVNNERLIQTTTFTGHDGLMADTSREQSIYTGLLLSETDAQYVVTNYSYDKTGRPLSRVISPDTVYENVITWAYGIETTGPVTLMTDQSGNQIRVLFDGAGREISRKALDADNTKEWFEISSVQFDVFGDAVSESSDDWLTSSAERYNLLVSVARDGWGNIISQQASDGTISWQTEDPIMLNRTSWMSGNSGSDSLETGKVTTQLDAISQLPLSTTRVDTTGKEQGRRRQEWDGLGRLCLEEDELGNIIHRTYDSYGRLVTQALPDGSVVTRTYAPHLAGEQVASISITGPDADGVENNWLVGTQDFDSFGRIIQRSSGGRTTEYRYENGAAPKPSTLVTPAGKEINYLYMPDMGDVLDRVRSDDVFQQFDYDKPTASLTLAKDVKTETENRNEWYPSGNLKNEIFIQNATSRSTEYTYTLTGQPVTYQDITGAVTEYKRDQYGRMTEIDDAALTTTQTYDALGRQCEQTVRNKSTTDSLTTLLTYDDFGREITRTITDSNGDGIQTTQTWLKNDLLESRALHNKRGELLRTETYYYDSRNRLTGYTVSGSETVEDAYGNSIKKQLTNYDALNNLTSIVTTLTDDSVDTETHHYDNVSDPMQLTSVTHTHPAYPGLLSLEYDANGQMTLDESGRRLTYDIQGRLKTVNGENISGGDYGYDALNRLVNQQVSDGEVRELYYRGSELVNEVNR